MAEKRYADSIYGSTSYAVSWEPSNNEVPFVPRGIYVGTGGDLVLQMADAADGNTITIKNVPNAAELHYQVRRILPATTAQDLVLLA